MVLFAKPNKENQKGNLLYEMGVGVLKLVS